MESTRILSPLIKSSTDPTSPVYTNDVDLPWCRGQGVSRSALPSFQDLSHVASLLTWWVSHGQRCQARSWTRLSIVFRCVRSLSSSADSQRVYFRTYVRPFLDTNRRRTSRILCCFQSRCALSLVVTPTHHLCVPTQASTRSRTSPPALVA